MHAPSLTSDRRAGFTLIELLLVIFLIGMMAAVAAITYDGYSADAQKQLAQTEIQGVKKALQQFKRDVGRYPCMRHPADFTEMILGRRVIDNDGVRSECKGDVAEDGVELPHWNAEYARGWRGPYLSSDGNGYVTIGKSLQLDGSKQGDHDTSGKPVEGDPWPDFVPGVADPFAYLPQGYYGPKSVNVSAGQDHASNKIYYLEWRRCAECVNDETVKNKEPYMFGRPYYVFELDKPARARIVSSGPNGIYETQLLPPDEEDDPHVCSEIFAEDNGDDVILCLQ